MEYAVLDGGAVVGVRVIPDWSSYQEHKKLACDERGDGNPSLRPIEGQEPEHDPRIESISGPAHQIEAGRVVRVWAVAPRDLATVKAEFRAQVDHDAEAQRLLYITSGAGMAMTYSEKKEQALAVLDTGSEAANALANNGAAEYPLLAASVGVEASSLYEAAELVMSSYEAWVAIGGAIESKRLTAKKAINDASDVQAVKAAYEAIQW